MVRFPHFMNMIISKGLKLTALSVSLIMASADLLWKDLCTQDGVKDLPFCNTKLDLKTRVADYADRVPIKNQISMMMNNAEAFEDLHILQYEWWSEGLQTLFNTVSGRLVIATAQRFSPIHLVWRKLLMQACIMQSVLLSELKAGLLPT